MVYIAWQQWRLARQRVKLDLFQKRLPLYHAAQALAAFVAANGKVTEDELQKFNIATRDAPFIFERRIVFYFEEMQFKAAQLWALKARPSELPAGQQRVSQTAEASKMVQWLAEQSGQITRRFVPVLGFHNL